MEEIVQIQLPPEEVANDAYIRSQLERKIGRKNFSFFWKKRSIDARKRNIMINATFTILPEGQIPEKKIFFKAKPLGSQTVHIIGAGPAGLFAALRCLELGIKPIVWERGKDVRARRRDLADINKKQVVNPESNYCFGEGGAGTYSDGKLYTRSKKRGDVEKSLGIFVQFGAEADIQIDAHPHIGTNKLPKIIVAMREEIIKQGGEVLFDTKLTDFAIEKGRIKFLQKNGQEWEEVSEVILATGHSARDIFRLLHEKKVQLYSKPFALGVRVEHRQEYIDKMQYHGRVNDEFLPPASYSLVTQVEEKGVFSFCMCPGGIIAPCATENGEVVTNGWSPSKRNNPYSNSGIVVAISPEDFENPEDPFVCLDFQKKVEKACWEAAGKSQKVPAQCLKDFVDGKVSKSFPRSSYQPGIVSVDLNKVLPDLVAKRLKKAFLDFDKKMKGFVTNDAVLHAPESRTSSPVQIPRERETFQHPQLTNLYPCAEGAGYAGGIISAAIDGMNCVEAIQSKISGELG